MADQRCPMCGKPNPADAEDCQHCQARLKPILPFSGEGAPLTPGEKPTLKQTSDLEPTLPDWLRDLRQTKNEPEQPGEEPAEDEQAFPDWLSSARSSETKTESSGEDDEADWLGRLGGGSSGPAFDPGSAEEPEGEADVPDWLSGLGSGASTPPPPPTSAPPEDEGEENVDWLNRVRARRQEDEPEAEEPAPSFPPADAPMPDWLSQLGSSGESGAEPAGEPAGESASSGLPAWLSGGEQPPAEEEIAAEPADAAGFPDWLSGLGQGPAGQASAEEETTAEPADPAGLPDWLSGEFGTEEPSAVEPAVPTPAGEMPDWLSGGLGAEENASQAGAFTGADAGANAQADETGEAAVPDWLSRFGSPDETAPEEPAEEAAAAPAEGMPDWLSSMKPADTGPSTSGATPALVFDEDTGGQGPGEQPFASSVPTGPAAHDMPSEPDWLSAVSSDEPSAPAEGEAQQGGLAPAQLPSWLEAMRPVESGGPVYGSQDVDVEKAGPLAGLRGILPAEPEQARARKGRGVVSKLSLPEAQQAHVALLESLLAAEAAPKAAPSAGVISTQYILRVVIALFLIAAVLTGLLLDRPLLDAPHPSTSPDAAAALNLLTGIPADKPVLVAFDYEPGMAGEMEAASDAVISQLLSDGHFLALVSTNTTGPVLAERSVQNLQDTVAVASSGGYANLGYIPGGPMGLLSFANNPRLNMPYTLAGGPSPWDAAPLSTVNSAADFGAVVVITENPDTGRAWIEQVRPQLEQSPGSGVYTPLVMIVSAQAEPMVRPYYTAGARQVDGLISGVAGGAAYENARGVLGRGLLYWDAYGAGLAAAAVLIVFAGIVNLVLGAFTRRKLVEGEAAK